MTGMSLVPTWGRNPCVGDYLHGTSVRMACTICRVTYVHTCPATYTRRGVHVVKLRAQIPREAYWICMLASDARVHREIWSELSILNVHGSDIPLGYD